MSLIKKSDVKNHLSTRRSKTVFPFGPINQPDVGNSGNELRDKNLNVTDSRGDSDLEPFTKIRHIVPIDVLIGSDSQVDTSAIKKTRA
jgi:hypothetical protein